MELYQIRTFVTVADEGHLTRAASRLNTSQPAVSAHIKALEEELGIKLFVRNPRGMALTKAGEAIRPHVEMVLTACDGLIQQARVLRDEVTGEMRIGLNSDPEFLRTSRFIVLMKKEYPRIDFHLTQGMSGQIGEDVRAGKLDGGYMFGDEIPAGLARCRISTYRLMLVGPAMWGEKIEKAGWDEIAALPWIGTPPYCPFHKLIKKMFRQHGLEPVISVIADQEPTIRSMVISGQGMTLMLEEEALAAEAAGEAVLWNEAHLEIALSFVYAAKRHGDPVIRSVLNGIREIWGLSEEQNAGVPALA
ncbi:LysR family transcriptional regulator [Desulfonema ishimotonii]|uniref:LysR family transcriptional regulator n=1 Tax=Desulfonema ishimotonii TaxID=45657 RepID=A0A401FZN9_9BACT|nr:LysR family transcriptional regulator [Desulfonema ishimotonii]GBC62435.1 LysR family transcriptional regulator [Desulfonema ishimotonii]